MKLSEIVKAWEEGKEIEYYAGTLEKWMPKLNGLFDSTSKYRIKPKAHTIWANVYRNDLYPDEFILQAHTTKLNADIHHIKSRVSRIKITFEEGQIDE